ncbi:iodothyronine deiodinase [Algoriphagus ratkowskyi]|uniref:Iodothyronine deiodinase n=1 Tax=Algoriphagus ratkowskyi TaxID=57028 RepID=A0A2W7RFW3_9BACT|nr:hypothetical protein [Algoriphagus ratkowskyi]PZX59818.1 iodothyronine deiodinase [Algoriphagus ratkowskyi]TXD78473.1 hypothetical protein ESW18_06685 [Algoriphagus ratkowskyi]
MRLSKIKLGAIGISILCFACENSTSEPIEFAISQGVLTKMDFSDVGIQRGQQLPDITFFKLNGKKFNISYKNHQRPKLLITGSYTCDITRRELHSIDWLYENYKDKVDVYLVNTLEAHPQDSPSPYSMSEVPWLMPSNIEAGIAAEQPRTRQERIELAKKWIEEGEINTPVLLDGAKNEFWHQVGQAPNMAILISPSGEVILKQSWFEKQEIKEALDLQVNLLYTE